MTTNRERCDSDRISALELQPNRRMLYFSDGVMEELSSSDSDVEPDVPDKGYDDQLQLQRELTLGPRLRYKASRMGNQLLAGIDYVGGGLASFLGITSSKYASELKYHKRAKEQMAEAEAEAQHDEDLDNNWQTSSGNNNNNNNGNANGNEATTIVVCAPPTARRGDLVATSTSSSMPQ